MHYTLALYERLILELRQNVLIYFCDMRLKMFFKMFLNLRQTLFSPDYVHGVEVISDRL